MYCSTIYSVHSVSFFGFFPHLSVCLQICKRKLLMLCFISELVPDWNCCWIWCVAQSRPLLLCLLLLSSPAVKIFSFLNSQGVNIVLWSLFLMIHPFPANVLTLLMQCQSKSTPTVRHRRHINYPPPPPSSPWWKPRAIKGSLFLSQ